MTILAISKGQPQPPERIAINAEDLADIPQPILREVFKRARGEKSFGYPQVSDLREMAGIGGQAEGLAEWDFLQTILESHVQRSGAEGYALCEGTGPIDMEEWRKSGKARAVRILIPEIPESILRAVRICGGWARFKDCGEEEYQWLKKEFLAAAASYDSTTMATARLGSGPLDLAKMLSAGVKSLPAAAAPPVHTLNQVEQWRQDAAAEDPYDPAVYEAADYGPVETPEAPAKELVGETMTDAEWESRRRLLQKQAAEIQNRAQQ